MIKDIVLYKQNEKWKSYKTNNFDIFYRNASTIAGDNEINKYEHVFLVSWQAKITIKDKYKVVYSPCEFEFPANTYHKIEAITDIIFLVFYN
jgi:mannose-6-phosphate isomerase-like protein (cupin superfamily)